MRAVFRCDLAVVAALCAIFRCNLAVVDRAYAAVRGLSAIRGGPGTRVVLALTIPGGSVEMAGRIVTRFGLLVTQPGGDVTIPRREPGLSAAHSTQLIGPRILTVLRGMCAIFGCNFAVIDGSHAAVGRLSAPRVGSRTFVSRTLTVARCTIACSSVAIAGRVVTRFGLSVTKPGRHISVPRSEPSFPPADRGQLVGPGILAVLGRLGPIVRCNSAVVDRSYAAIRGISAPRVGPGALVCRAPAVARRAIPCGSVELTCGVIARFGVSVTLLGGEVTRSRSQLRIFAILRGCRSIFGCKSPVVDGLGTVVRGLSPPRGCLSAFVCCAPAIAHRAIPFGAVEISRRVVARFSLSVTQPGRDVTILSSQPRLPTTRVCQLVGPGIFAVLGGLGTIFGRHLAVIDSLGTVVRSSSSPRGGLVTFVCRLLTVSCRAIPRGSIKIAGRVITRLGLAVTQSRRGVTVLRSQAGLPAAHSCQLVGPGIFAVLGGLGAIFGRNLAVFYSLRSVDCSLSVPRRNSGAFARRLLTLTRRAVPSASVEVTRRVITRFGLSVTLLGLSVAHVRSQITVAPF